MVKKKSFSWRRNSPILILIYFTKVQIFVCDILFVLKPSENYLTMSSKISSRAAQRMVSAGNGTKSSRTHANGSDRGGFCGAIQRSQPALPPSLARRLSNKETMGFGRVSRQWNSNKFSISESATEVYVWNYHFDIQVSNKLEMNFSWSTRHWSLGGKFRKISS